MTMKGFGVKIMEINIINSINPFYRKMIAHIAIIEAYLKLISKETLIEEGKTREEITFKKLGSIYKSTIKESSGSHGCAWEMFIYEDIKLNDPAIHKLINDSINLLTGERRYSEIDVLLWGPEKGFAVDDVKAILTGRDMIWINKKLYRFVDYIDNIYTAFHKNSVKKLLPKEMKDIWRTDLFVKKRDSDIWFTVTIKFNRSDVKELNGLSIGIALEDFKLPKKKKKLCNPCAFTEKFVYCEIKREGIGNEFLYMYKLFLEILENINARELKNQHSLIFTDELARNIFMFIYKNRNEPCSNEIMNLKYLSKVLREKTNNSKKILSKDVNRYVLDAYNLSIMLEEEKNVE